VRGRRVRGSRKNMPEIRAGVGWRMSCRCPSCGVATREGWRGSVMPRLTWTSECTWECGWEYGRQLLRCTRTPYSVREQHRGRGRAQVGVKREAQAVTPPTAAQFLVSYSPRPHHHSAFPPHLLQYCIHPLLVTAHPRLSSHSSLPGSSSSLFSVTRASTSQVLIPSRPGERKGGGGRGEISGITSDMHAAMRGVVLRAAALGIPGWG
jgi:hypothetical protein